MRQYGYRIKLALIEVSGQSVFKFLCEPAVRTTRRSLEGDEFAVQKHTDIFIFNHAFHPNWLIEVLRSMTAGSRTGLVP